MSVKILRQGLPLQSSGEDFMFPLQGTRVRSLVRGLGSQEPCGAAKKEKSKTHTRQPFKQGSVVSTPGALGWNCKGAHLSACPAGSGRCAAEAFCRLLSSALTLLLRGSDMLPAPSPPHSCTVSFLSTLRLPSETARADTAQTLPHSH